MVDFFKKLFYKIKKNFVKKLIDSTKYKLMINNQLSIAPCIVMISNYDHMFKSTLEQYQNIDINITYGILIADYRQSNAREYILNYLNLFNKKSGKYIDFFVPGYDEVLMNEADYNSSDNIYIEKGTNINGKNDYTVFRFNNNHFENFLENFEYDFNIKYTYNPMLVLLETCKCNYKSSKKIIIELDNTNITSNSIQRTGILFNTIFEIAKKEVALDNISKKIMYSKILDRSLLRLFITALGNDFIIELYNKIGDIDMYKLK